MGGGRGEAGLAARFQPGEGVEEGGDGRVPIIAMTANAKAGDRETCISAGMDGYVTKPVKKDALFSEVERVMGKGGANAARV